MGKNDKTKFNGYKPEVKEFFEQLKENNSKEWFDEHRDFYEKYIRDNSKLLIEDMGRRFAELGLPFVADKRRSMFRINRDIRFSKNKDPYKTNLGIFFPFNLYHTGEKPIHALGLYFHLDHSEAFIAGGLHTPPSDIMRYIRNYIGENWEQLDKIVNDNIFKKEFPERLTGESLKRIPSGFFKDHPAGDYLRLKQFIVFCRIKNEDTYSIKIMDLIEQKAVAITPFLEYFQTAVNLRLK